jgi:hypothetical protein
MMTESDLKGELEEWGDVLNPGGRRKDESEPV